MSHQKEYPLTAMCKAFAVSRSGYHEWLTRGDSPRAVENAALTNRIKVIHADSFKTYGSPRVAKELIGQGIRCGENRVARLMREAEIVSNRYKRRFKPVTTQSDHQEPVAENIINQDFSATAPNQKWGSDITYIPTKEGWLYLAVVLDFFSREIVGWATSNSLNSDVAVAALLRAAGRNQLPAELVHHSDRGIQYACFRYRRLLQSMRIRQSMSRKGNCYDNAMTESFFNTLKVERIHQMDYPSREAATADIGGYIENFYNSRRRHSSLGYKSPVNFLQQWRNAA